MPQPESKLVKKTRDMLAERGARCFKIHGDDTFQEVGIPDLLCCYRGRFLGLEAKLPGGDLSPIQRVVLYEIVKANGYAIVYTTVEQVSRLLAIIDEEVTREKSGSGVHRRVLLDRSIARLRGY